MKKEVFNIKFDDLDFSFERTLKLITASDKKMKDFFSDLLENAVSQLRKNSDLKAEYQIFESFKYLERENAFLLEGNHFEVGKLFSSSLKNVDKIAVFSCTLGSEIDKIAKEKSDFLESYVLNIASTEVTESLTLFVENKISAQAKKENKSLTNRYAPGYCGWDLKEQFNLLKLLSENYCNIELSENAVMKPIKSLSGIFGIGMNVKRVKYACQLCNSTNCIYRRQQI